MNNLYDKDDIEEVILNNYIMLLTRAFTLKPIKVTKTDHKKRKKYYHEYYLRRKKDPDFVMKRRMRTRRWYKNNKKHKLNN